MSYEPPKLEPSEYYQKRIEKIPDEPAPPPWTSQNHEEWSPWFMKKFIIYEVDKEHKVCYITLNRPEKLNAGLPFPTSEACLVARDDPEVKVIVIRANGRAFCAGYDITPKPEPPEPETFPSALMRAGGGGPRIEWWTTTPREGHMNDYYRVRLWDNYKPIIGSCHGFVTAGAFHMLSWADLVVASEDAIFGYPILRQGGAIGAKAVWPMYWGVRKTKEKLFTGCYTSAEEAQIRGYVNKVVPREKLGEETTILANSIATLPLVQTALMKRSVNNWMEATWDLRVYADIYEGPGAYLGEYQGSEEEYFTPKWHTKQREKGLSYALRQRDQPFALLDKWWREKIAARPKFQTGRLETDWKKIAENEKKKAEEAAKKTK